MVRHWQLGDRILSPDGVECFLMRVDGEILTITCQSVAFVTAGSEAAFKQQGWAQLPPYSDAGKG